MLKTLWDCGKKSRNEGVIIIHRRGIPDEGVIGSMGEEEDVGIGAIVTKWRENLKRGCYVRSKNDGFIGEGGGERDQGGASTIAW